LPPRSGLERSDFVPWPIGDLQRCPLFVPLLRDVRTSGAPKLGF
jgi:hypothetical protein